MTQTTLSGRVHFLAQVYGTPSVALLDASGAGQINLARCLFGFYLCESPLLAPLFGLALAPFSHT